MLLNKILFALALTTSFASFASDNNPKEETAPATEEQTTSTEESKKNDGENTDCASKPEETK
jgi:hypothetical protein